MNTENLIERVAAASGVSPEIARQVSAELLAQLHREILYYDKGNKDYIGEHALWELGDRGYYHLLGFLQEFSDRYSWESGSASEYLLRLADREQWVPYKREMSEWCRR
jgi:hypothetical protein